MMMKAIQYTEFGKPGGDTDDFEKKLQMVELPKPVASPGYAIVKVKAVSGNPVDVKVFMGYLEGAWDCPLPFKVGYDFAGTIDSLADTDNASSPEFQIGTDVFGVHWGQGNHGTKDDTDPIGSTFAEYVKISLEQLSVKPPSVSFEKAAAVALVGTTAYQALFECLKITSDSKILVLGGPTAVGSMALQLAKHAGAWVATTASTRNLESVKRYNPDLIINYREKDWSTDYTDELTNIDAVFDTVGETNAFERSTNNPILKQGGKFVSIANADGCGYDPTAHQPRLEFGSFFCLSNDPSVQTKLVNLVKDDKLNVDIDKTYPEFTLANVVNMFKYINSGTSNGKNVMLLSS